MAEKDPQERERVVKCLGELRALLAEISDMKIPIHDERFLTRFIRAKKYNAQSASETIQNYFNMRARNAKIFSVAYPSFEIVKDMFQKNVVGKLKMADKDGSSVIVLKPGNITPFADGNSYATAAYTLLLDEVLRDEKSQRDRLTFIFDQEDTTFEHIKSMGFSGIKTWLNMFQGSYPLRYKYLFLVNENALTDLILMPARPFFNQKLKERLKIIGNDYDQLKEIVPAEGLPQSLGGVLKYEDAFDNDLLSRALERDEYYKELNTYGYDKVDSDEEDTYM